MIPKVIVVPTDFSHCATRALDYACELATLLDATVHLVHAIDPMYRDLPVAAYMIEDLSRERRTALENLVAARKDRVRFGPLLVPIADPRDAILAAAETLEADLIVIGTHGRRGIARLVLGSIAEEVVRRAECPVLTVRTAPRVAAS